MNVCLVLCPSLYKRSPLIGLAYLSAYLKMHGHHVITKDFNAEFNWPYNDKEGLWNDRKFSERIISSNKVLFEHMVDSILRTGAEVIGFSTWATTKQASLALAALIKQKDKSKFIVFGGPECSFTGDYLIKNGAVDAVVLGEGEETLGEILSLYSTHKNFDFCPGTLLKTNNSIINCGYRTEIKDLDSLSFPDYSDFDRTRYLHNILSITFYRGCIRRCVFCNTAVTWHKFRSRSAESIFKEMVWQINKYPDIHKFEVDDTAINLDLNVVSSLCDLIITNSLKINWGGSALIRSDMDALLLRKMAKAGCNCIGYGLESGSQKIIDRIGKGFMIENAERVVRDTYNAGIETILGIIIGFPGETEENFNETLNFIERNKQFISWVHSPSECCIGCNSFMLQHPDKFDVVLDPDGNGENWRSCDSINTHEERQRKIKVFTEFLKSIGVKSSSYASVGNQ